MHFCSIFFFLTLVPFVLIYYKLAQNNTNAHKWITLAYSYFFYGMWSIWFLLLLIATTILDYIVARMLSMYPHKKRIIVAISIVANLSVLAFFKYANFLVGTFSLLASHFGLTVQNNFLDIAIPVGISFYTFHSMNYTVDVYMGKINSEKSFLDVALFIAFFPQLVAGPILRATDFLPQLKSPKGNVAIEYEAVALYIFSGLFLKSVIADNISPTVDFLFSNWANNSILQNWLAAFLFGTQIYCDFSGYSLMAIGLAKLLGFSIKPNFNTPYAAQGFSDFWKRWHISLSSWFRDYLYIPLGGNRHGIFKTCANLLLTMSLCGLWHGASFQFMLWGLFHGLLLCGERIYNLVVHKNINITAHSSSRVFFVFATYVMVSILWIPFRAQSVSQCLHMLSGLFIPAATNGSIHLHSIIFVVVFFISQLFLSRWSFFEAAERWPLLRQASILAFMVALYFGSGSKTQFIYFQF